MRRADPFPTGNGTDVWRWRTLGYFIMVFDRTVYIVGAALGKPAIGIRPKQQAKKQSNRITSTGSYIATASISSWSEELPLHIMERAEEFPRRGIPAAGNSRGFTFS